MPGRRAGKPNYQKCVACGEMVNMSSQNGRKHMHAHLVAGEVKEVASLSAAHYRFTLDMRGYQKVEQAQRLG